MTIDESNDKSDHGLGARATLSKSYEPAAVEAEVYDFWLKNECFKADPSRAGEPYSIVIPPPNVTGALHLGHAINNTLQDILTRVHRMRGYNTVWIPGLDHAGIATQAVVEKQLKEKEGLDRHQVGRCGLVERIWAWKQQYGDRILSQLQRLGCSCDWSRARFTLDDMCAKAVRETFFKLFKDGLVYRGKRLVNWDTHLQTSISDDEIYHENVKTFLWHIRYKICGTGSQPVSSDVNHGLGAHATTYMTVATTRPETLLGDTAVAVHSQDPRWNWAIGMEVELPLTNRRIPIIADDILVNMEFGSGVVKVTPAHDPNDYAVYQRHLGQPDAIDIINLMNPDGTLNAAAGPAYAGLSMPAARKKVIADLGDALIKEEPYETQVGHSDRSKTAIQPYLSDQWFVKMAPLAEPALEVVRDGTIKFYPERHAQQYLSWLGEKRDWPISRQLWWGHRIPVWHKRFDRPTWGEKNRPGWSEADDARLSGLGTAVITPIGKWTPVPWDSETLFHMPTGDEEDHPVDVFICVAGTDEKSIAFKAKLQRTGFIEDPDVLDTWFSSALWPHSTLGWPEQTADLAKWYPTNVLMTGRDIITLWVARMVMMGMYNMGDDGGMGSQPMSSSGMGSQPMSSSGMGSQPMSSDVEDHGLGAHATSQNHGLGAHATSQNHGLGAHATKGIPFHSVVINPTILDGKGERMSKSKGNGVDPVDIIDMQGADALRFTLTQMATETQDVRLPVKKTADGKNTSDKFDAGRNFCTKLWNAAKFALVNLESVPLAPRSAGVEPPQSGGLTAALSDRWIITRFNQAVTDSNAALAAYRFDQYAKAVYDFFWRDFCDWYVEAAKPAMKDPARSASTANVLAAVLDGILRLMHPAIPFITEKIWWQLNTVRPTRGLPGMLDCPPSDKLIAAQWPAAGPIDAQAEVQFSQIQEIISAVRTVRNQYNAKKPVPVTAAASTEIAAIVTANRETIELLGVCTITTADAAAAPPANAVRTTAAGCDLFIEGLIDPEAETKRIAKLKEELAKKITAHRGRLANPAYADRAPAHLVQQTRDELTAFEAELAKLG